jgi:hypothetical protein
MEGVENERVVVKFEWSEGVRTPLRSGWRTIHERRGEIGNFREKRATFIIRSYKVKPESVFLMARRSVPRTEYQAVGKREKAKGRVLTRNRP